MDAQNDSMIVSILRKDYPEIVNIIESRINENMPENVLSDIGHLPMIVDNFLKIHIHEGNVVWSNSTDRYWCHLSSDEYQWRKVTEIRETLIAVILMFYQPERILGKINRNKTRYGLSKNIALILNIEKWDLSSSLLNAITFYKSYSSFRGEVNFLYEEIKEKSKFFKN